MLNINVFKWHLKVYGLSQLRMSADRLFQIKTDECLKARDAMTVRVMLLVSNRLFDDRSVRTGSWSLSKSYRYSGIFALSICVSVHLIRALKSYIGQFPTLYIAIFQFQLHILLTCYWFTLNVWLCDVRLQRSCDIIALIMYIFNNNYWNFCASMRMMPNWLTRYNTGP